MRKLAALLVLAYFLVPATAFGQASTRPARDGTIDVRVDPRVELLSIVFRLAGAEEYRQAPDTPYVEAVDAWFGEHAGHRAIGQAIPRSGEARSAEEFRAPGRRIRA